MYEIYKNSPLIEVVFEIRFPAQLSIKCSIDQYYNKITSDFPHILDLAPPSNHLYQFGNENGSEIIKVGTDRLSYHTMEYTDGFAKFQEDALKHTQLFINEYQIKALKRTGLRYINHIPIVKIDGCIPLEKYLNYDFKLPPGGSIPNKYELMHSIIVVKVGQGRLKILIQYKELKNVVNAEIIEVDFDYYILGELSADNLINYLTDSHEHTKKVFEDLIAEDYRNVMREEE